MHDTDSIGPVGIPHLLEKADRAFSVSGFFHVHADETSFFRGAVRIIPQMIPAELLIDVQTDLRKLDLYVGIKPLLANSAECLDSGFGCCGRSASSRTCVPTQLRFPLISRALRVRTTASPASRSSPAMNRQAISQDNRSRHHQLAQPGSLRHEQQSFRKIIPWYPDYLSRPISLHRTTSELRVSSRRKQNPKDS